MDGYLWSGIRPRGIHWFLYTKWQFTFCGDKWGEIFILDIIGLWRTPIQPLAKQTESKVKDKDESFG